jgi:hypothetical protein
MDKVIGKVVALVVLAVEKVLALKPKQMEQLMRLAEMAGEVIFGADLAGQLTIAATTKELPDVSSQVSPAGQKVVALSTPAIVAYAMFVQALEVVGTEWVKQVMPAAPKAEERVCHGDELEQAPDRLVAEQEKQAAEKNKIVASVAAVNHVIHSQTECSFAECLLD